MERGSITFHGRSRVFKKPNHGCSDVVPTGFEGIAAMAVSCGGVHIAIVGLMPPLSSSIVTTVIRVGDAWLVGVGKRAPHGLRCLWWSLVMAGCGYYRLIPYHSLFPSIRMLKHRHNRAKQGRAG